MRSLEAVNISFLLPPKNLGIFCSVERAADWVLFLPCLQGVVLTGQTKAPETEGGSCRVQCSIAWCETSNNSAEGRSAVGFRAFFFFSVVGGGGTLDGSDFIP